MSAQLFCLPLTNSGLLTKLPYLLTNHPDFVRVRIKGSDESVSLISFVQAPFWTVTGAEETMFWACESDSAAVIFLKIETVDGKMMTKWLRRKGVEFETHPTYPTFEIVLATSDSSVIVGSNSIVAA